MWSAGGLTGRRTASGRRRVGRARKEWLEWVRVDRDLESHPKLIAFAGNNSIPVTQAIGEVVRLWFWVARYAPDGTLDAAAERALIATGVRIQELISAKFLTRGSSGLYVPNWRVRNGYTRRERRRKRENKRALPARNFRANGTVESKTGTATESPTAAPPEIPTQCAAGAAPGDPRDLVRSLAAQKSGAPPPPAERAYVEPIAALTAPHGPQVQREALQLAGRLFNAGVRQTRALEAVIRDWLPRRHRPGFNPYAYYSPGGAGFAFTQQRASVADAESEHEAHKAAERDWLRDP